MKLRGLVWLFVTVMTLGFAWEALAQIKVGAVVPLTGRYAALGAQVKNGYEIAVEHINAAGGVAVGGKKQPIELIEANRYRRFKFDTRDAVVARGIVDRSFYDKEHFGGNSGACTNLARAKRKLFRLL